MKDYGKNITKTRHVSVFGAQLFCPVGNQRACSPVHSHLEIAWAFVPHSLFFQAEQTSPQPQPEEQEQRVVTSCGDFAMWRNWHGDEITLVLLSDLKECEPTDLIYMQTLADALIHTTS